jgi:hypothetical protein
MQKNGSIINSFHTAKQIQTISNQVNAPRTNHGELFEDTQEHGMKNIVVWEISMCKTKQTIVLHR